jgi:hypothetical protein
VVFCGALSALVLVAASSPEAHDELLPGWFDLQVPGGEAALAALGFTLQDRAFTLPVLARALFDRDQRVPTAAARLTEVRAQLTAYAQSSSDAITIAAPLDAEAWRDILPAVQTPESNDLFTRIVTDRRALLTAYGLVSTTDSVRAFLARERDLLRFIYEEGAGGFAIASRYLEIADGRVVVPGGTTAEPAWQALAGVSPSRASAFIRALVSKDRGRLAWYFDTVSGLPADVLTAAWPAGASVDARAAVLYGIFRDSDPQWRADEQPFRRVSIDAWMVVTQNAVANGAFASPFPQATWALLFDNNRLNADDLARTLQQRPGGVSFEWLARETLTPAVRERRSRYEMFRLAQRVFVDAPPSALTDVAIAVHGVRDYRALVLALERMQVREPAVWRAAVEAARHVSERANDRRESLAIFQAVVALIERMRHARSIDAAEAAHLIRSLSDAVRVNDKVTVSAATWLTNVLAPSLPRLVRPDAFTTSTSYESTILQALAGPVEREIPTIEWEGLSYVADPVTAEHERLQGMRQLLPSPGLDAALAAGQPRQIAEALMALVYATALGDPQGPASLSPDVASRHQFGLSATAVLRDELPWAPPEERQGHGPWHVQGSLIGLDLALSRLFLRRIADQQMPQAPTLTLNDLGTLTRTAAGMVPSDLQDAHRDALAAAIGRGRERVARARTIPELMALAAECGMSTTTRRLLPWIASRQREAVADVFALRDLLWLGKPQLPNEVLDRWGASADALDGRRVLAMPRPAPWEDFAGRSEIGQVSTQVPDLTLRLVEETARLELPAQLVPSLLAFALQDYWHDVRARFADDWPRLTRHAAALPATRVQDYVAALAGGGPLRAP